MQQCTGDGTVSRVLHIVALTPPNTTVAKSDVCIFDFFYDPTFHLNHQNTKKEKTHWAVFRLKVAQTGHLMLIDELIKLSSLIYSYIYICLDQLTRLYVVMEESRECR